LPVGKGLLYVQPIYTIQTGTSSASYPILRYVTVAFGEKFAIGTTIADAVRNVLELDAGETGSVGEEDDPLVPDDPQTGGSDGGDGGDGDSDGGEPPL